MQVGLIDLTSGEIVALFNWRCWVLQQIVGGKRSWLQIGGGGKKS